MLVFCNIMSKNREEQLTERKRQLEEKKKANQVFFYCFSLRISHFCLNFQDSQDKLQEQITALQIKLEDQRSQNVNLSWLVECVVCTRKIFFLHILTFVFIYHATQIIPWSNGDKAGGWDTRNGEPSVCVFTLVDYQWSWSVINDHC